jgi:lipopolysaccharide export system protein LptC
MSLRKLIRYWPIVPLLIVVLVAREWAETTTTDIAIEETIDMRETQADYYLEDFVTRRFNSGGELEYKVIGNTLAHYPIDDRSEITEPQVSLFRPRVEWHMESALGELTTNPEVFTLRGNVVVKRSDNGGGDVWIETTDLQVHTDANEVSTDQPIEIVAETWQLRATGLRSAIDDGRLILQSNVIGHFAPPQQNTQEQ